MKSKMSFKIIHFGDREDLQGNAELDGKVSVDVKSYPANEVKEMPVLLTWKYKITNLKGDFLFSYIADNHFMFAFDYDEDPTKDLAEALRNGYLNLELNWSEKTKGWFAGYYHLPAFELINPQAMAQEITAAAKAQSLLKQ